MTSRKGVVAIDLESKNGLALFHSSAEVSLEQGVQMVKDAIISARQEGFKKLLINISGVTGFESPTLGARYFFIREWAAAAEGSVRLALVAPKHMIDPEKFGVLVASNAGLVANIFASEEEALAWL
jgi:hypothetical protein